MKQEIIYTTLGEVNLKFTDKATHIRIGGINYWKELSVAVFTDKHERSGYLIHANILTGEQRLERIQTSYINAWSFKHYGRKCHKITLPLFLTPSVYKEKHKDYFILPERKNN